MQQRKTLILIPTYNERENAERLCLHIIGSRLDADILFLDDFSLKIESILLINFNQSVVIASSGNEISE